MQNSAPVIVIGASAGGVGALRTLVAGLPRDLPAAVFIVLHVGAHKSELPQLLNDWGALPACHPANGAAISQGHIYVAPPDHHMVVEHGIIRLTRGPRENWARPAIDPLFRSAARAYGAGVIGIVLTGGLNDGTAGLIDIKQAGGIAIVQSPDDALDSGMPRSALRHVAVDHCLPVAAMPGLLTGLLAGWSTGGAVTAAAGTGSTTMADYKLDTPVAVTCPDCGGALRRTELGSLTQFACHIGHVYTAEVMVAAQFAALEWSLAAAMRSLSERGELCRQMAERARAAGTNEVAALWETATGEAKERAKAMARLLSEEWTQPGEACKAMGSGGME